MASASSRFLLDTRRPPEVSNRLERQRRRVRTVGGSPGIPRSIAAAASSPAAASAVQLSLGLEYRYQGFIFGDSLSWTSLRTTKSIRSTGW